MPPSGGKRVTHPNAALGKVVFGSDEPRFSRLKTRMDTALVPELMQRLGFAARDMPVIWDADFLYGPRDATGADKHVLCEINVSSVFAIRSRPRPRSPNASHGGSGGRACRLALLLVGLMAASASAASSEFRRLNGREIAARLTGMTFTDEAHWSYRFQARERLAGIVLGRPREAASSAPPTARAAPNVTRYGFRVRPSNFGATVRRLSKASSSGRSEATSRMSARVTYPPGEDR